MNTSLGYSKKTLTDSNVLLSGGGDKSLSDFIGSLNWDSTNNKLLYKSASANSWTDLLTFGSNAFNSTSYLTSISKATTSALGGVIISNALSTSVTLTSSNGSTSNRYYGVQVDKDGKAFVNIPWVWTAFTAASSNAAGTAGYILAPAGAQGKYFRGDNTWQSITSNVTSALYVGASNGTSTTQQTTNGNVYLIFAEGSSYTRYNITGSGRNTVKSDSNGKITIDSPAYSNFGVATSSAAGSAGLVPAPAKNQLGSSGYYLRADCSWAIPPSDNTWRKVLVAGTERLGTGTSTGDLKFVNGTNTTVTWNATNKTILYDCDLIRSGTATSLTSLDVTKSFIYATLSANVTAANFTLSAAMTVGLCLTVLVYNSGSTSISIGIPSSWLTLDGYTLYCSATKFLEISIVRYSSGANDYIVSSKAQ